MQSSLDWAEAPSIKKNETRRGSVRCELFYAIPHSGPAHNYAISEISPRKNTYENPNWQVPFSRKAHDRKALDMDIRGASERKFPAVEPSFSGITQERNNPDIYPWD